MVRSTFGFSIKAAALAALATTASHATTVTYNTGSSAFSCGTAIDCTAAGYSVLFSDGTNTETISFLPGSGLVSEPSSNVSFGYLSLSTTGSPIFSLAGVQLALNISTDNPSGSNGLVSTFSFSTPFGAANPVANFSPASAQIGNDVFQVSGGFTPTSYAFSTFGSAQITGTIAAAPVPEPATISMMLLGLAGVALLMRRRADKGVLVPA
jgi:hypothetical protein